MDILRSLHMETMEGATSFARKFTMNTNVTKPENRISIWNVSDHHLFVTKFME